MSGAAPASCIRWKRSLPTCYTTVTNVRKSGLYRLQRGGPAIASPLVSIIILTWNGKDLLNESLTSLRAQTYAEKEIIVVDNGSTDGTVPFIRERWGSEVATIVTNPVNLGYARGNNQGIRASRGDLIALMNNDVRADPRWLEELVNEALAHPDTGMFAGKILLADDPSLLDNTGHLLYPDGLNFSRGRLEKDRGQYDAVEEAFFPSGAAALFRRALLEDVQGFDDDFFAYGDDADLGLRARLRGWTCLYVPRAVVYHRHSATSGEYSALKAYLVERNRIWVAVKCFPAPILALSPLYSLIRYIFQAYGAVTRKGAAGRFSSPVRLFLTLIRAWAGALKGVPKMWAKRRVIQKGRKMTTREFYSLTKKFGISTGKIALTP